MVVSRGKSPSAQETFMQMAQASGLRSRLLVTAWTFVFGKARDFYPCSWN
jgi:preprotein translocase subunit SecY